MKTIVVLVDFSDVTFKLMKQAYHLASVFDSHVVLLHAVPPQPVVMDFGISPTIYEEASAEAVAADKAKLDQLQESLAKFGITTSVVQVHGREVVDLVEECKRVKADLIVVGTHGHGAFYNLIVGSVTAELIKRIPCPVLVVPKDEEASLTQHQQKETSATSTASTAADAGNGKPREIEHTLPASPAAYPPVP